jgi:adenine C2-methylase RlmN of 23S rRNA A2503 and tRNA A37
MNLIFYYSCTFHHNKQPIFIEYIMLDVVKDQVEQAHHLGKLLETFCYGYQTLLHYSILSLLPCSSSPWGSIKLIREYIFMVIVNDKIK